MSNSYTPPDKSTYDPGWNDPPPMSSSSVPQVNKARPSLNKRVAFPMQGSPATASAVSHVKTADSGLPLPFSTAKYKVPADIIPVSGGSAPFVPPPLAHPPPMLPGAVVSIPSVFVPAKPVADLPSDAREFCEKTFSQFLKSSQVSPDAIKVGEIEKRLDILNSMWLNGKFNTNIEGKLYDIAKALEENNVYAAKDSHLSMMLSDAAVCSQWGTALRHLILGNEVPVETNLPTELPDNNTPPFLNVTDQSNETNSDQINAPAVSGNTEKSGRFGPILHL